MRKTRTLPYERYVQWLSGPVAIVAGLAATYLTSHFRVFGTLGLGKSQVAHAISAAVIFGVSALVTYAGHHKWLSNVPAFWGAFGQTVSPLKPPQAPAQATTITTHAGSPVLEVTPATSTSTEPPSTTAPSTTAPST